MRSTASVGDRLRTSARRSAMSVAWITSAGARWAERGQPGPRDADRDAHPPLRVRGELAGHQSDVGGAEQGLDRVERSSVPGAGASRTSSGVLGRGVPSVAATSTWEGVSSRRRTTSHRPARPAGRWPAGATRRWVSCHASRTACHEVALLAVERPAAASHFGPCRQVVLGASPRPMLTMKSHAVRASNSMANPGARPPTVRTVFACRFSTVPRAWVACEPPWCRESCRDHVLDIITPTRRTRQGGAGGPDGRWSRGDRCDHSCFLPRSDGWYRGHIRRLPVA